MQSSVFIATSLDGFIARNNGALDWLPAGHGEPHGYDEFIATVDAIVIGRKTFETVLVFDAWPYGKKPVVVLSTRATELKAPAGAVCDMMCGTPTEIVARLTQRGMQHLYIDGGVTIEGFLRAGLIQRLTITRIPVLLGSGIPLFGPLDHDVRLQHIATRSYPSGMVQSEYLVAASSLFGTHVCQGVQ
jgi:dihydrofolate reductase